MHLRPIALLTIATLISTASTTFAQAQSTTQKPALTRTILQTQPLSVPGREGVQTIAELAAGGTSARHTHPGEEFGYVISGTATLDIAGQPAKTLKAGDVFFIPANAPHTARNTGATPWKIIGTYFVETGKPLATPTTAP
jgi:quercetin dioxygenase-like cupin family protein